MLVQVTLCCIAQSVGGTAGSDLLRKDQIDAMFEDFGSQTNYREIKLGDIWIKWGRTAVINGNTTIDFTDKGLNNFAGSAYNVQLTVDGSTTFDRNVNFNTRASTSFRVTSVIACTVSWLCIGI